ncbi:autoinducer binding domain-containing protein [Massilia niastensis]|uniref:autoinducer binding domain-containing protein n=1 Tax=Massilia niastensis TaxID=544911 RepID=UPI000A0746B2|nr:autoinducer binding domain-containing protein [Massilia niastensis]
MRKRETTERDYHAVISSTGNQFEYLEARCRELGFDYCATGILLPIPVARPKIILENNYAASWREKYKNSKYLAIDPTIPHVLYKNGPARWSDTHGCAQVFWEEAAAHDLKYGLSILVRHSKGVTGMLSIARGHTDVGSRELELLSPEFIRLSEIFGVKCLDQAAEDFIPEADAKLTPREIEVLRWTADGKTAEDVANLLSISRNTVNFHIKQASAKLNALNKTQVVVKALLLHLL